MACKCCHQDLVPGTGAVDDLSLKTFSCFFHVDSRNPPRVVYFPGGWFILDSSWQINATVVTVLISGVEVSCFFSQVAHGCPTLDPMLLLRLAVVMMLVMVSLLAVVGHGSWLPCLRLLLLR